ncbi:MAG: LamG domain-containing protein, partial [Actinomycetes bacterium]
MSNRYKASVLSATAAASTSSIASGVWKLSDVTQATQAAAWPIYSATNDIYFKNVPLLLHGDGTNGATNNTFIDSSANALTVTRNGSTTQGSFSPYGPNWSNFFDGSAGYINTTSNAVFNFGTGAFTVEAWVYYTTIQDTLVFDTRTTAATSGIGFQINSSGVLCYIQATSTSLATTALTVGTWNHVAWVFNGTSINGYVNGVAGTASTIALSLSQNNAYVGRSGVSSASFMAGYITNLRVTKGGALYTSGFTPSTTPLTTTVSSGTVSLLTCKSNRFIDTSVNTFALTVTGTPYVERFSPFNPSTAYDTSTIGGAAWFNPTTTDYLAASNATLMQLGTNNFTIEFWVYFITVPSNSGIFHLAASTFPSAVTGIAVAYSASSFVLYVSNGSNSPVATTSVPAV